MIKSIFYLLLITCFIHKISANSLYIKKEFKVGVIQIDDSKPSEANITLNDNYRFKIVKKTLDNNSFLLSIVYVPEHRLFLGFRTTIKEKKFQTLSYCNQQIPFKIYQFHIYPSMPFASSFYKIADSIKYNFQGLTRILEHFNLVDWTPAMLNYFYDSVQYPKFYYTESYDFPEYFSLVQEMNNTEDLFHTEDNLHFDMNIEQFEFENQFFEETIKEEFYEDIKDMMNRLYQVIQQDPFFDINYFIKNGTKHEITKEQKEANMIAIEDFHEIVQNVILDNLEKISNYLLNMNDNQLNHKLTSAIFGHLNLDLMDLFNQKEYVVLQVLLERFQNAVASKTEVKYYKTLKKLMRTIKLFSKDIAAKRYFIKNIIRNYTYDILENFNTKLEEDSQEFIDIMKTALKNIFKAINKNIKRIPGADRPEVHEVRKYFMKEILKKYFDRGPVPLMVIIFFFKGIQNYFEMILRGKLFKNKKLNMSKGDFVDKLCKCLTLLGGANPKSRHILSLKKKMFDISTEVKLDLI